MGKPKVWKPEEVSLLQKAHERHGSQWKQILEDEDFKVVFLNNKRTPKQLEIQWSKIQTMAAVDSSAPVSGQSLASSSPIPGSALVKSSVSSRKTSISKVRFSSLNAPKPISRDPESILLGICVRKQDQTRLVEITQGILARIDVSLLLERAQLYLAAGTVDLALMDLQRAHELEPLNQQVLIQLGLGFCLLRDYRKSVHFCNSALRGDSECFLALYIRSLSLMALARVDAAFCDLSALLAAPSDRFLEEHKSIVTGAKILRAMVLIFKSGTDGATKELLYCKAFKDLQSARTLTTEASLLQLIDRLSLQIRPKVPETLR
jgi:hypothetical protein